MKYHYEDEDLKIIIFFPKKEGKLIANATIILKTVSYGLYTTKGFQIWHSSRFNERLQEPINITPPTKQISGRFLIQAFFEDKNKWYELENFIYSAYLKARQEKTIVKEDINPNEIPI